MARKIIFISAVVLLTLLVGFACARPKINMNPGKWEITTRTTMPGIPPRSVTHTQCIKSDDLLPMSQDSKQTCRVTDTTISGNTVSWKISCGAGASGMSGSGEVTYEGDSMRGSMVFTMKAYGTTMKNTIAGRRIGDCD
ncbi:MAG: DUF3617 family protein [Spirochaetes bacterium]|nr:DUF3617 family protein [Spirochaetota bacterium]